jgi:hypothetical protein
MTRALRLVPLTLILIYLLSTIALFYLGPLRWPVTNPIALNLFLSVALGGIVVCYVIGSGGVGIGSPVGHWRAMIVVGALLNVAILFPSAHYYADKMPWQLFEAMRDQNAVYEALQKKLAETAGSRTIISIVRAVTYPLIFAVLPLSILKWRAMNWRLCLLALAAMLSSFAFSMLRGTDREVFDVFIIAGASMLVAIGRWVVAVGAPLRRILVRPGAVVGGIAFIVAAVVALSVFADRRVARAGYTPEAYASGARDAPSLSAHLQLPDGWLTIMCIRKICLQQDHLLIRQADVPQKYAALMLTSYLTQGYYGLSLAMTQSFHSTLGLGHSPVIARTFERITHSNAIYERGYTYGLRNLDWSDESQWSTIFPWLANDVSFPGAILVISLLAFLWGRSWRDAIAGNDGAAIVFCLLFQLFIYVPANNQLAQTFDAYLAVTAWCGFWLFGSRILRVVGKGVGRFEMRVR